MFIDTHCHLDFESFTNDLPDVLARAERNDVKYCINPGIDLKSSKNCLALAHQYSRIFAAIGVHPNDLDEFSLASIKVLAEYIGDSKCVAVGEIGLDYYHNASDRILQLGAFTQQLELAIRNNLPVIVHSREALKDVISTLMKYYKKPQDNSRYGIIHSFEGNVEEAWQVIELGFHIGIGGPVTYKNSHQKQSIVKEIPLSSIVLETDCPFLSPASLRGTRNEPANIKIIAEKIAYIKECDIKQVALQTTRNTMELFRIGEEIDLY